MRNNSMYEDKRPSRTPDDFKTLVQDIKANFIIAFSIWRSIYAIQGDQNVVNRINSSGSADFANCLVRALTESLIVKLSACTFDESSGGRQCASIMTAAEWLEDIAFIEKLKLAFLDAASRSPDDFSITLCSTPDGVSPERIIAMAREELTNECHVDSKELENEFDFCIRNLKNEFRRLQPARRKKISNINARFRELCMSNQRCKEPACYEDNPSDAAIELLWIQEARNKAAAHRDATVINESLYCRNLGDFNIPWARVEVLIADLTRTITELESIATGMESNLGEWIARMTIQCQAVLKIPFS